MDFRTRIANQMGALLLANIEQQQTIEDAQDVAAKKDAHLADVNQRLADALAELRAGPDDAPVPA